jgi:pimeloyl-ACP methyl ester carboxylesterase
MTYLNYTDQSQGETIVFLHGFTESLAIWNHFSNILSKRYRVICIDLPGHGKSECMGEVHLMENMAEAVDDVITKLGIKTMMMVGHSMGGYVALNYGEMFPEKLKGLCLFHSQAAEDAAEIKASRARTIEIVKQNHFEFINQFIPDLFAPANRERLKVEIDKLKADAREYLTKEGIVASIEGMRQRKDKCDFLLKTETPVLFIAGKQDSRIPLEKVTTQLVMPKHAEALILDVGHMGYLEAPDETLRTIECFAARTLNPSRL